MGTVTFFAYPDPVVWWHLILFFCAYAWGSFVIGCFGVGGGAVFVPVMLLLPGMKPQVAVGIVFVGNVVSSWLRNYQLYRYGRLQIRAALPLMAGAVIGALLGQVLLPHIPSVVLAFFVACLAIFAGVQTQKKVMAERRAKKAAKLSAEALAAASAGQRAIAVHGASTEGAATADVEEAGQVAKADEANLSFAAVVANEKDVATADVEAAAPPKEAGQVAKADKANPSPAAAANDKAPIMVDPTQHWYDTPCFSFCGLLSVAGLANPAPRQPAAAPQIVAKDPAVASKAGGGADGAAGKACPAAGKAGPAAGAQAPASPAAGSPAGGSSASSASRDALGKFGVGVVASLASSLSGTGGPLILFPLWLLWDPHIPMKRLIGFSAPFASTMVTFSAIGVFAFGEVDIGLAMCCMCVGCCMNLTGGVMMERMGDSQLKLSIGVLLMLIGSLVGVRTLVRVVDL